MFHESATSSRRLAAITRRTTSGALATSRVSGGSSGVTQGPLAVGHVARTETRCVPLGRPALVVYVTIVAPVTSEPSRYHWYWIGPVQPAETLPLASKVAVDPMQTANDVAVTTGVTPDTVSGSVFER